MTEGDILNANYADANLGGSDADNDGNENTLYIKSLETISGRAGQTLAQISALGEESFGGQFKWGDSFSTSNFGTGVSRFYRWRIYVPTECNFRAASWPDGSNARSRNKFLILADGDPSGDRMILNLDGNEDANWNYEVIFDGSDNTATGQLSRGSIQSTQIEVRYVTGGTSYVKLWHNTDVYASPTMDHQAPGVVIPDTNGFTTLGGFCNDGLRVGGVYEFTHFDFRMATTFDANWHGSL